MGGSSLGLRPAECCCFYGWTIFTVATAVRTHTCTVWIGETPTPLTPLTPTRLFTLGLCGGRSVHHPGHGGGRTRRASG